MKVILDLRSWVVGVRYHKLVFFDKHQKVTRHEFYFHFLPVAVWIYFPKKEPLPIKV